MGEKYFIITLNTKHSMQETKKKEKKRREKKTKEIRKKRVIKQLITQREIELINIIKSSFFEKSNKHILPDTAHHNKS